jgi:predicted HTH transcriptional regulator
MEIRLRTTRTLKVTEVDATPEEKEALAQLYDDPRYQVLLNAMERAIISLETAHFNTDVGNPEAILGGHALTKAAWLFFTYTQKQVNNAYHTRMTRDEGEVAPPSLNDMIQGVEPIDNLDEAL